MRATGCRKMCRDIIIFESRHQEGLSLFSNEEGCGDVTLASAPFSPQLIILAIQSSFSLISFDFSIMSHKEAMCLRRYLNIHQQFSFHLTQMLGINLKLRKPPHHFFGLSHIV
ncbi:hypothetical protein XENORESO_012685 [Xenotaenia resolanae]|uniref:Uncharacterized protein n=1 Tax=Xenotaenia resolanae TaxID=208358 RepID=A0ABV0X397_9TELE